MENNMERRISAVITAAGMSSRMGEFKPLLSVDGKFAIENIVDTFKKAGVHKVVVVCGYKAEELKQAIIHKDVEFVFNPDFQTSQMFDSVLMGFKYLSDKSDIILLTPADVPVFSPLTVKTVIDNGINKKCEVVLPSYKGTLGHPVLFNKNAFEKVMTHNGYKGLMGAIEKIENKIILNMPDKGISMDMDTSEDYKKIIDEIEGRKTPSEELCFEVMKWAGLPDYTIRHCIKVAEISYEIGNKLNCAGYSLDLKKIFAGALLHDIGKGHKWHAQYGSQIVKDLGFDNISEIVRCHMDLGDNNDFIIDEKAVVFYADKIVEEDINVGLEKRFAKKRESFKNQPEALEALESVYSKAKRFEVMMERVLNYEK